MFKMLKNNKIFKWALIFVFIFSLFTSIAVALASCVRSGTDDGSGLIFDLETLRLVQLDQPESGTPVAVIDTNMGRMKAVLYPEYAPDTVDNFIRLAESGYYDNTYIYSIQSNTSFRGGAPNKDGSLDEDYNPENESINLELHQNLWPFRGALCALNTDSVNKYTGSRFMILDSVEMDEEFKEELLNISGWEFIGEAFAEYGGLPNISQKVCVFGQIYDGLDVISAITSAAVSNENAPLEDIIIKSVTISEY